MGKRSKKKSQKAHQSRAVARTVPTLPQRNGGTTRLVAVEKRQTSTRIHQGPLPSPETLAGYDSVHPGFAERIVRMAENQSQHRMGLEKTIVNGDNRRAYLGIAAGLIVVIVVAVLSWILITVGQYGYAVGMMGISLASIVGVFVYGTNSRRQERENKQQK